MRDDGSNRLASCTVHNVSVNRRDVGVGHFTCEGRHTGKATAKQLSAFFLHERGIDMVAAIVIMGDACNQGVGWRGGWMTKLEELLGRPLSSVVSVSATRPSRPTYRAPFLELDGQSVSPGAFAGYRGARSCYACRGICGSILRGFSRNNGDVEADFSSDFHMLYQCANVTPCHAMSHIICREYIQDSLVLSHSTWAEIYLVISIETLLKKNTASLATLRLLRREIKVGICTFCF